VLSDDIARNGLSGVIEIRNGRPAISIGTHEESLDVHIESDVEKGLFVHTDKDVSVESATWHSSSHDMEFSGLRYFTQSQNVGQSWLDNARKEIAEHIFSLHEFGDECPVIGADGWEVSGNHYRQTIFLDNPSSDTSIKGCIAIVFAENSTYVLKKTIG